ncbi:DUF5309 family protein [Streptomyces sp. NPDC017979]|uniref:SU10 major capsid protein n=1 Tax=Streptomyces sp. NPDC017979 TaxID=3365024 RepID=UPI00379046A7
MAGITGMGTTFDLPNYVGELFALTPENTPFLSAIGGLTGGGMTAGTEFEWQTYDLRDPGQRTKVEGAAAPTAEERVRANVRNVVQIHQEKVSVSYTKQATMGMLATPTAAPYRGAAGSNPVTNELDWQVEQALKSLALDINWSYLNGTFANPTTNANARRTRGLLQAITTNRIAKGTTVTGATSATDTITSTAHGLVDGDRVVFTATGAATGVVAGRAYYVDQITTDTFKVSTSAGGAPITLGTATLAFTKPWATALTTDHVSDLLQMVYDNGGISEQGTATLVVNSSQRRALTKAFASAYGQYHETSRTVGGVAVDTIVTDFGTLNVMMDRHLPQDTITVASLEMCRPVFLNVPGKGTLFEEPLAKTGASDEVQLYGETGLEYGNERAHGVLTGLKV